MSFLKIKLPKSFDVHATNDKNVDLFSEFSYQERLCFLSLEGDEPFDFEDGKGEVHFIKEIRAISIAIKDNENNELDTLIRESEYEKLSKVCLDIINHCIRIIRNFGFVYIHEESIPFEKYKGFLLKINAEYSYDGRSWENVVRADDMSNHNILFDSKVPFLNANLWEKVDETLKGDSQDIPPENEFTVNSIEHMNERNYRMALLESIIGLEIVFTSFLEKYMSAKKIGKKSWSSSQLNIRIKVLLPLIFKESDIVSLNLQDVYSAIKWRNKITHESGNFPRGVTEEEINKAINAVIQFTFFLSRYSNRIEYLTSPFYFMLRKNKSENG